VSWWQWASQWLHTSGWASMWDGDYPDSEPAAQEALNDLIVIMRPDHESQRAYLVLFADESRIEAFDTVYRGSIAWSLRGQDIVVEGRQVEWSLFEDEPVCSWRELALDVAPPVPQWVHDHLHGVTTLPARGWRA